MLDTLRRGATGWVAKILLSVLVLSFAIWGIADTFRTIGHSYLAKVGTKKLMPEDYQQELRNVLNAISAQARRRITPEEARQFGLDSRALTQLIGKTAIDQHAEKLRLTLSDQTVADQVKNDPAFKGLDGKFSKIDFDNALHSLGLSERGYLSVRRAEDLREMLTSSLTSATVVAKPMIDLVNAYREETRSLEHFTIDPAKVRAPAAPDDEAIKKAYEGAKSRYMTPEYRSLAALVLSMDSVKSRMKVADDEVKAAFDADPEHYNTPERRQILQIAFKDKAAAEAAKAELAKGKSFADVAKEAGAKETDINLGVLTKKQIIDPKIANAAFALAKDAVSDVVQGRFATVLLKVTEITSGTTKTLADVKDQIKDSLARDKAQAEIQKIYKHVDDARAAQRSLVDTGKELNLPAFDVAAVSKDNKTPDGKTAIDSAESAKIVAAGFEAQVGVEHDVVELGDGGYAWVDVKGITPPQQKPLESVREEIKTQLIEAEKRKALADLAAKLVERASKGEAMATLAAEAGGKLDTALKITRDTLPQGMSKPAVTQAFALPKDRAGSSDSADNKSRVVFKVTDIVAAPPPTKEQSDRLAKELQGEAERDILATYVASLEERFGVSIDETVLKRTLGTDRQ